MFPAEFSIAFYVPRFPFEALSPKCIFITATEYSDHSINLSIEQTTSVETLCILIVRYNQTVKSLNRDWERVIPQDYQSLSCGNPPCKTKAQNLGDNKTSVVVVPAVVASMRASKVKTLLKKDK